MIEPEGASVEPGGDTVHGAASQTAAGSDSSLIAFFINRDCDTDRRYHIERQIEGAGITGARVTGVNALAVPDELRNYFFDGDKLISPLNPGEVGCYASHLKALRAIVDGNLAYALVLEDDAILPADTDAIVKDILANIPVDWDVVHICGDPRRATKPIAQLPQGRSLVRYSRIPSGAFGYLVSQSGARKLLKPTMRYWPFDTDLRCPWLFDLQVYGVAPKIVEHGGTAASVIIAAGGRSRARRGLPVPSRGAWTGNPLHCPEGVAFNFKTLGPTWWFRCWRKNLATRLSDMLLPKALRPPRPNRDTEPRITIAPRD